MKFRPRFSLLTKVAALLVTHLLVLAVAFFLFVTWQLRLGLDSLLTGATGERLESLGERISKELRASPQDDWDKIVEDATAPFGLSAYVFRANDLGPGNIHDAIPIEVMERVKKERPPAPEMRRRPPPGRPGFAPERNEGRPPPPRRESDTMDPKVLFLTRDSTKGNYWAAIELQVSEPRSRITTDRSSVFGIGNRSRQRFVL